MKRPILIVGLAAGLLAGVHAQTTGEPAPVITSAPVDPAPAPASVGALDNSALQSLEALQRALALKEQDLTELQARLAAAPDELAREDLWRQVTDLRAEVEERRRQFERFATDIDLAPFDPEKEPEKFDWQQKVGELLEPIMAEIANATKDSRVIGDLRTQLEDLGRRRDLAAEAVANLDGLLAASPSAELGTRLTLRRDAWARTLEQIENEHRAVDLQLQSRLAARESVLDQSTRYAKHFFRTRGMNLLLGIGAFLAVFFGVRLAASAVRRARSAAAADAKSFGSRLIALIFHLVSILGGMLAMLAVFNAVGDWFLLGIVVIFLLGVGWASVKTLPQQIETIKLMLNIGAVREGQWLAWKGTPYRVDALGLSAHLRNPLLDGGEVLMPVKYLVGEVSRPVGDEEPWFPTRPGDWVELADGTEGRVIEQTPACVQLTELGGARRTFNTADFIALRPRNRSTGFRIETVFGIDYRHQAEAVEAIPAAMRDAVAAGLAGLVEPAHLRSVEATLSAASASSLDITITVDVEGAAAEKARDLRLAVPRLLVAACQQHGWTIPFTQITVHQAG
jgi:hypothetical protein